MKCIPVLKQVSFAGVVLLLLTVPVADSHAAELTPQGIDFFEKKIRPVLVKYCYECHSADSEDLGGKLYLDTRQGVLTGGETGPAVVPKNLKGSLIWEAIQYKTMEMPPAGKLPAAVIADIRRWILMGAPDPRDGDMPEKPANGSQAISPGELWSLQPISDPKPPKVTDSKWPHNDIDRFILQKLEAAKLKPVGPADPLVLLRRIHFDLIGLPPSPEGIARFQSDHSPQAFSAVVDRLLSSPQFGERWGRHWLDVARFAESNGRDRDVLMPHAWRYRDYVIDSLNADMPFNRFVTEQLAGDLLDAENAVERDRMRIATAFLAIGSKSLTGATLQMDLVDEQIDVVGKSVLGLTVSCARCHDHKFDPIPTKDYYALAGIFRSTDTRFGGGLRRPKDVVGRVNTLLVLGENSEQRVQKLKEHQKVITGLNKKRAQMTKKIQKQKKKLPKDWKARKAALEKSTQSANPNSGQATEKTPRANSKEKAFLKNLEAFETSQQKLRTIQDQLKKLKAQSGPTLEFAVGVQDAKKIADCRIHIRGDKRKLGDAVPRGFLSCVDLADAPVADKATSGRLQLAQWLTHPQNPLTPRVAVNRVWQHLFGRGIVTTVDNFGINGRKPTHPELLDYLAKRFLEEGWSFKRMIRRVVLSRTYQLSVEFHDRNYAANADNSLLWRMNRRRLEAEALRDAMLVAANRLNLERPHASAVTKIGDGEVGRGINIAPLSQPFPHRSVYLPIIRGIVPEMLKAFDFPEPSNPQGRRDTTNVPAQSLFLMNNPWVIRQAESLAKHLLEQKTEDANRITQAYNLCFARFPQQAEIDRATDFLARTNTPKANGKTESASDGTQLAAWTTFCQALFAASEFRYLD